MPDNVMEWLAEYDKQIRFLISKGYQPSSEMDSLWRDPAGAVKAGNTHVDPLMETRWKQKPYYNSMCPGGALAGCVATATGQIMKYWNYPATGYGSHCYASNNYGTLCADFESVNYDWVKSYVDDKGHLCRSA